MKLTAKQLVEALRLLGDFLGWYWRRHKILTRWPCRFCGRQDGGAPLRMVEVRTEDGKVAHHGCPFCNEDVMVARAEEIAAQLAPEIAAALKLRHLAAQRSA